MLTLDNRSADEKLAAATLTAWLQTFEDGTVAEVRSALGKLKVKGGRRHASACPLTNGARRVLSRKHLGSLIVMVGVTGLTIIHRNGGSTRLDLPRAAREFVMNFDMGMYPELDDGN